jgi:hypothetical protein
MTCFSLVWFQQFLVWLVLIILLVAVVQLVIPFLLRLPGMPPGGGMVGTIIGYVIWALIAIAVIYFVFETLIPCAFGSGGFPGVQFPRPR